LNIDRDRAGRHGRYRATIWVAVGVPMIVATGVPKRTETVPTLKLFPNSVTFVPAGRISGLNWLGDAAKVGRRRRQDGERVEAGRQSAVGLDRES